MKWDAKTDKGKKVDDQHLQITFPMKSQILNIVTSTTKNATEKQGNKPSQINSEMKRKIQQIQRQK